MISRISPAGPSRMGNTVSEQSAAAPGTDAATLSQLNTPAAWALRGGCLGLVAGLIELGVVTAPALMPQSPWPGMFHINPNWIWLKPLADAAIGSVAAGTIACVNRWFGRTASRATLLPLLAVLLFLPVFPYAPRVNAI